jgi:hypothetical protein
MLTYHQTELLNRLAILVNKLREEIDDHQDLISEAEQPTPFHVANAIYSGVFTTWISQIERMVEALKDG